MIFLKKNYKKILLLIFLLLGIHLFLYTFVFCKCLADSDMALFIDYSLEVIKSKSIIPVTWVHTNDFWVYSLIPMIIPFLKLGINLFISRQIAVFIQSILLIIILYDFFKNVLDNKKGFYIILAILLTGISGEMMLDLFGDGSYGTIMLFMTLSLSLFLKYIKYDDNKYLTFLGCLLLVLSAFSMRFIIFITAPLICALLFLIYKKGFKKKYIIPIIVLIVSTLLGLLTNYILVNNYMYINYLDKTIIDNSVDAANNFSSIIFYYLQLMGSTAISNMYLVHISLSDITSPTSPLIVITIIRFITAIITVLMPIVLIKKINKLDEKYQIILIFTMSFIFFIIFFMYIGNLFSWYRYIEPIIFLLLLLYPIWYQVIFEKDLKNRVVFYIYLSLSCLASFILIFNSYFNFKTHSFRVNPAKGITEFLLQNDLHYGYSVHIYDERNLYYTLSEGKLTIAPIYDTIKPYYWANSLNLYKKEAYDGNVFLLKFKDYPELEIENEALYQLEFEKFDIFVYENIDIFIDHFNS